MKTLNYLHLEEAKTQNIVKSLSQLLADFHIYYMNLRGFHWNVKGVYFFGLHAKYESLYNDAAEKIDEIAERILQLGGTPENRFSEYLKIATLKEDGHNNTGLEGLQKVLDMISQLIKQERDIVKQAAEAEDETTVGLMDEYLAAQEKTIWMLQACLSENK